MKLIVAIVHNEDAGALVDGLLEKEYRATRLHSSGGFLKQSNATIIVGVEEVQIDEVLAIIRRTCTARTQIVNPMPPIM
ncbi:MAG TPA: cyclic-di-AMP receptor, partial [Candidatus Limnocylindrales bacterium]